MLQTIRWKVLCVEPGSHWKIMTGILSWCVDEPISSTTQIKTSFLVRNIFLFIRRYFNFLLFILLQVLSVYFIIHYSKFHEAAFGNFANQFTGRINDRYNSVEKYFQLKRTNDSLVAANERLYNKLKADFEHRARALFGRLYLFTTLNYRRRPRWNWWDQGTESQA